MWGEILCRARSFARISFFDFAIGTTAVAGNVIAVVAFFASLGQRQAIAADRATGHAFALKYRFDFAIGATTVAGDVVAVVARLALVDDAIAAFALNTSFSGLGATPTICYDAIDASSSFILFALVAFFNALELAIAANSRLCTRRTRR